MKTFLKHTITMLLLLARMLSVHGQSGFFVPAAGKIFFTGDTATIFSNVKNSGQIGVGKGSVVNFKGVNWENSADAQVSDESNNGDGTAGIGGIIQFLVPDETLAASVKQQQEITGGYNAAIRYGASFGKININNPWGVRLTNSSARIRQQLNFQQGHLFLNDNILSVGNGNPGLITGYDENKFIVTGPFSNGGLLLREQIKRSDGYVTFPVGTTGMMYAPAAIRLNSNQPDDFTVGLFDGVKSNVSSGTDENALAVNKTWSVGKLNRPGQDLVDVMLQHRIIEEGSIFKQNRSSSFISEYINGGWDTLAPGQLPQSGTLTTGPVISNSATNTRAFSGIITSGSYLTKLVHPKDTVYSEKTYVLLRGYRINDHQVSLNWTTYPEVNIKYFVMQRMLSNETVFSNVGYQSSKAAGPGITQHLEYDMIDPNGYKGISYYRVMLVDYDGNITYSNLVPVGPKQSGFGLTLWPNPTQCRFFAGISGSVPVESIIIMNVLGQKVQVEKVNNRNIIPMAIFKPGDYYVIFVAPGGQFIETKKLLIVGY